MKKSGNITLCPLSLCYELDFMVLLLLHYIFFIENCTAIAFILQMFIMLTMESCYSI